MRKFKIINRYIIQSVIELLFIITIASCPLLNSCKKDESKSVLKKPIELTQVGSVPEKPIELTQAEEESYKNAPSMKEFRKRHPREFNKWLIASRELNRRDDERKRKKGDLYNRGNVTDEEIKELKEERRDIKETRKLIRLLFLQEVDPELYEQMNREYPYL